MLDEIVPQKEEEVKQECDIEWCHEEVFRQGLCWEHFCQEKIEEWDNQAAERLASEVGIGYIFGDPVLDELIMEAT